MNAMQGSFYSTAFRVRDEQAFVTDPAVLAMQTHMNMFKGKRDGTTLHCLASKDTQPQSMLDVHAAAIHGLLDDADPDVAMEDTLGWIGVLQAHLQPNSGIVIIETAGEQKFMTYIAPDRAGWTRRAR